MLLEFNGLTAQHPIAIVVEDIFAVETLITRQEKQNPDDDNVRPVEIAVGARVHYYTRIPPEYKGTVDVVDSLQTVIAKVNRALATGEADDHTHAQRVQQEAEQDRDEFLVNRSQILTPEELSERQAEIDKDRIDLPESVPAEGLLPPDSGGPSTQEATKSTRRERSHKQE